MGVLGQLDRCSDSHTIQGLYHCLWGFSLFLWGIPARVAPGPLLEVFRGGNPPLLVGSLHQGLHRSLF